MHSRTSKHGAGQRPRVLILFEFRAPGHRQPAAVAARCIFVDNQSVGNTINNSIFRPMGGQWASSPLDSIYLSVRSICPEVMMRSNNGGADGLRDGKTKTVSRERANGSSEPNRWRSTAGLRRRQHFRQRGRRIFHYSIQIRNARCC